MEKVLIANRGEIAVRIIRACRDLGLQTVAVYSTADVDALHVLHADEAVCIGPPRSSHSYLKIANILSACEVTGADGLHPGYGFLSENANFASICESCGIKFIGPPHTAIARLGDKAEAKALAKQVGCPVIPGSDGIVETVEEAEKIASEIGFPIFIKAVAGGGGKGIRIARSKEEFSRLFVAARAEAEANFGNPGIYLERMIVNPRHIEIQVFGDTHGNYVHLGERDCTIQRRRQKLIEESPSPILTPEMRDEMGRASIELVRAAGYCSAGTVEFLVDEQRNFYFMEVNTRIQVEHTVTEECYGVDLLAEQLRVAMGEELSFRQEELKPLHHVIQYRINAENPLQNFTPSPGKLREYLPPGGPNVRFDSACYPEYVIPPHYDSMIAKLLVRGANRKEALQRGKRALTEFHIEGVHTTIPFHLEMCEDERFTNGEYTITYVDDEIEKGRCFGAARQKENKA